MKRPPMDKQLQRLHTPTRDAWAMIRRYAAGRLGEQVKAVAFIIIYLIVFQVVVLNTAPDRALQIAAGIGLTVFGLTFFLEGLFLGLMPLGERVGLKLPHKLGIAGIIFFSLLLGVGSTLAEPAIAALRMAGGGVTPWDAPLLFRLLEIEPDKLVMSIGVGVGVAVVLGMMRFYYGFSIKGFVFSIIPLLLLVSGYCAWQEKLAPLLGLAWDAGAVTTGPVTVPLVLALGIGVSRASGKQGHGVGGFGVVMLASALPILAVLILGLWLNPSTPSPRSEADFFAPAYRTEALRLVASEADLERLAFQRGSETGRRRFYSDDDRYQERLMQLAHNPAVQRALLGKRTLNEWRSHQASSRELDLMPASGDDADVAHTVAPTSQVIAASLAAEFKAAFRAVLPLTALLLVVLLFFLRDAPRHADEVVLGITFAFLGMTLLGSGISLGLAPLGDQVGRPLPRVFRATPLEEGRVVLQPFDLDQVHTVFQANGTPRPFFYLKDRHGVPAPVPFDATRFDPERKRYEHIIAQPPLFGPRLTVLGIALVLLFAFGLGFGSTLAEPALRALGRTVEELTAGNIRGGAVVRAVSVGVGGGLIVGVTGILYDIPSFWLILPPYAVLVVLTIWSKEDITAIAWDCGGVTTGPVTVPLVMAMGLGIGRELQVVDAFGVLAMASAYPILSVLLYGYSVRWRQQRRLQETSDGGDDE